MKKFMIIIATLTIVLALASCSAVKLADIYDEAQVTARGKEVVEVINTQDYDAVNAQLRQDLQGALSSEKLKDAWDNLLTEAGSFEDYSGVTVIGQKSQSTGEDYAAAVLTCKYENATRVFTIIMDKDLAVVGMYMK